MLKEFLKRNLDATARSRNTLSVEMRNGNVKEVLGVSGRKWELVRRNQRPLPYVCLAQVALLKGILESTHTPPNVLKTPTKGM